MMIFFQGHGQITEVFRRLTKIISVNLIYFTTILEPLTLVVEGLRLVIVLVFGMNEIKKTSQLFNQVKKNLKFPANFPAEIEGYALV